MSQESSEIQCPHCGGGTGGGRAGQGCKRYLARSPADYPIHCHGPVTGLVFPDLFFGEFYTPS